MCEDFFKAFRAALAANRIRSFADPRPSAAQVATELRTLGWIGGADDAQALARQCETRLADSEW